MKIPFLILLLTAGLMPLRGEEPAPASVEKSAPTPGHSLMGEAFNEGPRQSAVLMEGLGNVHFPITTKSESAQRFFDQGVCQLHGFWYFEAERSFRQVLAIDPDCTMAYWGLAMANINNRTRAAAFIKKAMPLKDGFERREKLWIESLASYYADEKGDEASRKESLVEDLEKIGYEFPEDMEAKAFLIFQIWDNGSHRVPVGSRSAVDALARQVLAVNPKHPGVHHYLIHLWDAEGTEERALPSAAMGGQLAPGIAHLWHMPGHTYSALHRYGEAAWQQEASARVDHAYTMRTRVLPDQIHNYPHNNDWLVKNLGFSGRVHAGVDLAKNMIELPRLGSKAGKSYQLGRERLLATLWQFELWDELIQLADSMYLAPFEDPIQELLLQRSLGLAWIAKGNLEKAEAQVQALKTLRSKAREERTAAIDLAESSAKSAKKSDGDTDKAVATAVSAFRNRLDQTDSMIAELEAEQALAAGDIATAKTHLELARNIDPVRSSRARFALGEREKALKLAREASKKDEGQTRPLANLVELLWRSDKKEEALDVFDKLRKISAQLDLDVPVFSRLAPMAAERKLTGDWRLPAPVRSDLSPRPELATLGPFHWSPSQATAWTLKAADGTATSLSDYQSRPVLVFFYLGSGCPKCIEQLNVFEPLTKEFADAGIQLVAISTESQEGLEQTFAKLKARPAFPILSDEGLDIFKAYGAFDDFEKIPLHGVFLIDAAGRVRWQDISFEAFRDAPWLLKEAKRLLLVPAERSGSAS